MNFCVSQITIDNIYKMAILVTLLRIALYLAELKTKSSDTVVQLVSVFLFLIWSLLTFITPFLGK
jgi:uncharacterized protein YhhL (DUF1145 family)